MIIGMQKQKRLQVEVAAVLIFGTLKYDFNTPAFWAFSMPAANLRNECTGKIQ